MGALSIYLVVVSATGVVESERELAVSNHVWMVLHSHMSFILVATTWRGYLFLKHPYFVPIDQYLLLVLMSSL